MSEKNHLNIGRRNFLKSVFGLGTVSAAKAKATHQNTAIFYWADLKSGQIGFPSGLIIRPELPGSLMKLIASTALVEEGIINPNHTIDCPGQLHAHQQTFSCLHPHGRIDLVHAIANSCNVYFVEISKLLPAALFIRYARLFSLDSGIANFPAGIFSAREGSFSATWKYVLGLAEELKPNALQILSMSALIGCHGIIPALHSADQEPPYAKPRLVTLKDITWNVLHQGMQLACSQGTAHKLDPQNTLHIAAKTGTAPHGKKFESWITGFFPYENPLYAFCLNAFSGTSQQAAVPKARELLLSTAWPGVS